LGQRDGQYLGIHVRQRGGALHGPA
jgi:hypothetical protein